ISALVEVQHRRSGVRVAHEEHVLIADGERGYADGLLMNAVDHAARRHDRDLRHRLSLERLLDGERRRGENPLVRRVPVRLLTGALAEDDRGGVADLLVEADGARKRRARLHGYEGENSGDDESPGAHL